MDIFLQILQNFRNSALFKTIFKNTFRTQPSSEHMLSQTTSFENSMYLKLTYFLYHNLILFSENTYKKEAQMCYQNHSLALRIQRKLIFAIFVRSSRLRL